jgi:hypothetical protein
VPALAAAKRQAVGWGLIAALNDIVLHATIPAGVSLTRDDTMARRHFGLRAIHLMLLLAALFFDASPAVACSPVPPDPWFVEIITFDTRELSAPITLSTVSSSDFPGFRLHNPSQTALVIPPTLPNQPTVKVVTNEWFEQRDGRWEEITEALGNVTVRHAAQPQLDYLQPQYTGVRPASVSVPAPQQATIQLMYDDHLLVLPITIRYALSPAYRPESYAQYQSGAAGCSQRRLTPLLISLSIIVIAVGAAIGGAIVKRKARLKQSNDG